MGSRIRDGARAALPLALAPILFGASFGLLAGDAGMGWAGAITMSATTFAGSAHSPLRRSSTPAAARRLQSSQPCS